MYLIMETLILHECAAIIQTLMFQKVTLQSDTPPIRAYWESGQTGCAVGVFFCSWDNKTGAKQRNLFKENLT